MGIVRHIQRDRRPTRFPRHKHGLVRTAQRTQWRRYDAVGFVRRKQPTPPAISERGWPGEQKEYGNRSETAAIPSQVHGWRSFYSTRCTMQAPRRSRLQTEGATSRLHTVALNSGAWMTDEARRRRRPWRTAALNVGAWITREHAKRHWAGKRHLSMLEPGRQPHCRLAAPL